VEDPQHPAETPEQHSARYSAGQDYQVISGQLNRQVDRKYKVPRYCPAEYEAFDFIVTEHASELMDAGRDKSWAEIDHMCYVELATVPDCHYGSWYGSEPNNCDIGGLGCQQTRTINLGTVQCNSPNPSGLGGLTAGCPACPSVDLYKVLVFAVG
jgi:hypothetical protein